MKEPITLLQLEEEIKLNLLWFVLSVSTSLNCSREDFIKRIKEIE